MKGLKYITGCSLTLLLLAACNKEEGPSIDDYFLNYEIPEIPVTEDYQVGIFYNKNGDLAQTPNGEPNFTRWELLTKLDSELSAKTNYNNLTPQIMPESQQEGLLEVKGDDQSFRMITHLVAPYIRTFCYNINVITCSFFYRPTDTVIHGF